MRVRTCVFVTCVMHSAVIGATIPVVTLQNPTVCPSAGSAVALSEWTASISLAILLLKLWWRHLNALLEFRLEPQRWKLSINGIEATTERKALLWSRSLRRETSWLPEVTPWEVLRLNLLPITSQKTGVPKTSTSTRSSSLRAYATPAITHTLPQASKWPKK